MPTAIASLPGGTYTHVKARVEGLTYTTDQYDSIYFKLYKWNGATWDYQTGYSAAGSTWGTTNTYAEYTFTYQEPEETYKIRAWANYGSTWYPDDPSVGTGWESGYVSTGVIPKPVVTYVSNAYNSITFSRTITTGAITTQLYITGNWETVGNAAFVSGGYSYSTSGDNITISGLAANTGYYVRVINTIEGYVQINGTYDGSDAQFVLYYASDYPTLSTPNTPSLTERVTGGFSIYWNTITYADNYRIRYGTDGINYSIGSSMIPASYILTGLDYSTTYYLGIRAEDDLFYDSAYSSSLKITTAPRVPTLSFVSATTSSISVSINVSSGAWNYVRAWYRLSGSSDVWNSIVITYPTTTGTITGLTSGEEYEIKASTFKSNAVGDYDYPADIESVDSSGNTAFSSLIYATATARPTNWAWTTTITAGTNVPSVSGKTIYIMPATEWNNFTAKINLFRVYKGLATYSFTSMSSNTELTKAIINEALVAIRAMSAYFTGGNTVPADRVTGDNILQASVYQNMRDAMNSIT